MPSRRGVKVRSAAKLGNVEIEAQPGGRVEGIEIPAKRGQRTHKQGSFVVGEVSGSKAVLCKEDTLAAPCVQESGP
jgi:hypothetical protein